MLRAERSARANASLWFETPTAERVQDYVDGYMQCYMDHCLEEGIDIIEEVPEPELVEIEKGSHLSQFWSGKQYG